MSILKWFRGLLEHPVKVGIFASILAFASLLAQGTLIELWNLKAEKWRLEHRYSDTLKANQDLEFKIEQARNSDRFIGRQAREKLDLVKDDELVFIFENESYQTPTQRE